MEEIKISFATKELKEKFINNMIKMVNNSGFIFTMDSDFDNDNFNVIEDVPQSCPPKKCCGGGCHE